MLCSGPPVTSLSGASEGLAVETGRPNVAARAWIRALQISEHERIRRSFLDAGPWLRRAIAQLIDNPQRYAWLGTTVLGGPAADRGSTAPTLRAQPLTSREQDILRKLAGACPTKDIATEMFLSIITVKTHLGSVYRKLMVSAGGQLVGPSPCADCRTRGSRAPRAAARPPGSPPAPRSTTAMPTAIAPPASGPTTYTQ
jgi:LuxR family maltose regulon positive regulatory protein